MPNDTEGSCPHRRLSPSVNVERDLGSPGGHYPLGSVFRAYPKTDGGMKIGKSELSPLSSHSGTLKTCLPVAKK